MKVFNVWCKTKKGSLNILVVCKCLEAALRHGKSLGEVTSIIEVPADSVAVLDSR